MGLLNELPQELLLEIFFYVSAVELWNNVRIVCKSFYVTLSQSGYWAYRASVSNGLKLPARLEHSNKKGFISTLGVQHCSAVEKALKKWKSLDAFFKPKTSQIHFATVDATKIFRSSSTKKKFCFTGSRDRSIILWDMDKVLEDENENSWIVTRSNTAHEGWIWQLCVRNDCELYSAGWDRCLRQWYLTESQLSRGAKLSMETAVLSCLCDGDDMLYCSTFTSGPIRCDIRAGIKILDTLKCHGSRSVFSVATGVDSYYVYSVGEDNRLVQTDKRNFTKSVRCWKADSAISRICYSYGYLGVGMRNGLLQFFNPETLEIENSLWLESNSPMKPNSQDNSYHFSMTFSKGTTFCAYGHKLKAYLPGLSPRLLTSVSLNEMITQMDCFDDCLVVGTGTGAVYFW